MKKISTSGLLLGVALGLVVGLLTSHSFVWVLIGLTAGIAVTAGWFRRKLSPVRPHSTVSGR
ncbi:MAG TPA: hypothetical protein VN176_05480 [Verrucomicrobiae bacterium]|nr:hypothetical protein [Verrucomicrobiae bacterium]